MLVRKPVIWYVQASAKEQISRYLSSALLISYSYAVACAGCEGATEQPYNTIKKHERGVRADIGIVSVEVCLIIYIYSAALVLDGIFGIIRYL